MKEIEFTSNQILHLTKLAEYFFVLVGIVICIVGVLREEMGTVALGLVFVWMGLTDISLRKGVEIRHEMILRIITLEKIVADDLEDE